MRMDSPGFIHKLIYVCMFVYVSITIIIKENTLNLTGNGEREHSRDWREDGKGNYVNILYM